MEEGFKEKFKIYLKEIGLDSEEENNYRCNWVPENNSRTNLEIDGDVCACFIDWQKVFDLVKWTKFMHILNETGIDWCERKLISRMYTYQSFNV